MAEVDRVVCYGCGEMFAPWTNEWFCSETCEADYPHDKWPRAKFSNEDHTSWDDYWWQQRYNAEACSQGQKDAEEGKAPQSTDPVYMIGYQYAKEYGGGRAQGGNEPAKDSKL